MLELVYNSTNLWFSKGLNRVNVIVQWGLRLELKLEIKITIRVGFN